MGEGKGGGDSVQVRHVSRLTVKFLNGNQYAVARKSEWMKQPYVNNTLIKVHKVQVEVIKGWLTIYSCEPREE